MNRLIAATFLFSTLGAGFASAMPLAPWRRQGAPMSSKSPADAAPAGIAGPMADAYATTPTPPRMPASAAFTLAPRAADAATAVKVLSNEFD